MAQSLFGDRLIEITPDLTVDTSAYATGDLISKAGTVLAFKNALPRKGASGIIQSCQIFDAAKQSVDLDLVLFRKNPSATTFTDNAAFDPADADGRNIFRVIHITNWSAFNDNSFGQDVNVAQEFTLDDAVDLYGALVSRGAPTYAAATDLRLTLGIIYLDSR